MLEVHPGTILRIIARGPDLEVYVFKYMTKFFKYSLAVTLTMSVSAGAAAYDVSEQLSVGGMVAAAGQQQLLSDATDADDSLRGNLSLQPEISFRPTARDELFIKFGLAEGNGLNPVSPFVLAPWSVDMEFDVHDINGRGRDYLLTAWYRHAIGLEDGGQLLLTAGIIDATDYLDSNRYANDGYTQFMNAALVNGPNFFAPSYDAGGVAEWQQGAIRFTGLVMNIGENEHGNGYNYYAVGVDVSTRFAPGEGNYRVSLATTSDDFSDASGLRSERRLGVMVSLDQQFGPLLGGFLRLGWQDDAAAVDYRALYSGGLDISGSGWGRAADNIGVGYAWLDGANSGIAHTHVAEAYYRLALLDGLAVSADLQYMKDAVDNGPGAEGFICGLRATAEF